jgi:hypothetical protein
VYTFYLGAALLASAGTPPNVCNCCSPNAIGNIGGFWYDDANVLCTGDQDEHHIRMCWRLNHETNPADSMVLYVADNPDGPARRVVTVKPLDSPPPEEGKVGPISHVYPLPDSACYYYWLDHGPGGFAAVRDPKRPDLYANSQNPICYTYGYYHGGKQRDVLDPPDITQIADPPLNNGNELLVSWQLSANDAVVDFYNVYQYAEGSGGGFHWIGSVPHGTTSFRDTSVFPGITYSYRVSAAHHGAAGDPVSSANRGIWNDFSEPASATAINDFPVISSFARKRESGLVSAMPQSPAVACPQGDIDEIVSEIVIEVKLGAIAGEASCVPANALTLSQPTNQSRAFFPENVVIHADSATMFVPADPTVSNAHCRTTFTVQQFSGCGRDSALVSVYGVPLGYAQLNVKSPDVVTTGQSRGKVDTADFGRIGAAHQSSVCNCVYTKTYDACVDYVPADTLIHLNDLAFFYSHWGHAAPGGGIAPQVENAVASGTIVLEFEEVRPVIGEHKLFARMSLEGVGPFKAAVFAVRNENPKLEFTGWIKSDNFVGETLPAETVRDGRKEVFIGVLGEYEDEMGSAKLGTAEFRVHSDEELELTDEDLALVVADILSNEGEKTMAVSSLGFRRGVTSVVYKNELAQNYPNPFNPLTTIAFSLERNSHANLSIYDVRGALVRELLDGPSDRGIHRIVWDGSNGNGQQVASGVYFYKLVAGSFTETRKMTILK